VAKAGQKRHYFSMNTSKRMGAAGRLAAVVLIGLATGLALAEKPLEEWDGRLETLHEHAAPSGAGKTQLMEAAAEGALERIGELLAGGAQVDQRNANGGTALMYAASAGHLDAMRLLLDHGADPEARARIGWTAMLVAAAKGQEDAVALLLDAGADPRDTDAYGWTPLMRAVSGGYEETVAVLLACGRVDLKAREESGATVLHIAAGRGYASIVKRLLEAGAERLAADGEGRTPADVARLLGHQEAEALLRG